MFFDFLDKDDKDYDYGDFLNALKTLPDEVATPAFTEWMTAFTWGKKEEKQKVCNKYVKWANYARRNPDSTKPWLMPSWQLPDSLK